MIKKFLLLILLSISQLPAMEISIDLFEDQPHPWKHMLTKQSVEILLYWLIQNATQPQQQWLIKQCNTTENDREAAKEAKFNFQRFLQDCMDSGIGLLSSKIGTVTADQTYGIQPKEEYLDLFDDQIPSSLKGCQTFRDSYNALREEKTYRTAFFRAATQLGTTPIKMQLFHYIEKNDHRKTVKNCIQFELGNPSLIDLTFDKAEWAIADNAEPLHYFLNHLIRKHYQNQLIEEAAYQCGCHKCIEEIVKQLPEDHPWRPTLIRIAQKMKSNGSHCLKHKISF